MTHAAAALATLALGVALLAGLDAPWAAWPVVAALWGAAAYRQRKRYGRRERA